jgi:uncharacterized membrane protein (UPF0127 family)
MNWIEKITHLLRGCFCAKATERPLRRLRVVNRTREAVLATQLELAGESSARTKGLLGRAALEPGGGLWIIPCEGVHTIGMQFPIDLIYIDKRHRVRKVRSAVPPWRLSLCLSAESILELPAGVIRETQTQKGDQIEFSPAESDSTQA